MQMKFDIPDWEDAKKRCENMDGSPIDAFVSYNEPGDESAFMFREQLRDLIDYIVLCCTDPARNLTTHGAERHTCPSCGANMVEVAPGRLHCECGEEVVG